MKRSHVIFPFVILLFSISCNNSNKVRTFWPDNKSPEIIGQKVIDDFFTHGDFWIYQTDEFYSIHYAEACAAFGIARLAGEMNDKKTLQKLTGRYNRVFTDSIPITGNHVDANVYGILPLELHKQTNNERFLKQGLWLADQQWENPRSDGLTDQTRFWIDDVWMIGSLQTQAFRVTGKMIYLDRAALELDTYLEKLQQPNGLFYHGSGIPFHWGRGNGWVAAGLAELLSELPKDNPHYVSLEAGYLKMMKALVENQAEDGMWRQLIDVDSAWKETSSTAMFGYAITLGVKRGILKEGIYTKSYQKAWLALTEYLGDDGKITDVCVGTGQQNDINYYLNRPKVTGDYHGQAPLLWFAWSLIAP